MNSKKKSVTVVMAARVESKRCQRKVAREFFEGKSLFDLMCQRLHQLRHPFAAAVGDEELVQAAHRQKVPVIERSHEEVNAHAPLLKVFKCMEKVKTTHAMLVSPCTPNLTMETINKACDFFIESPYRSMSSCTLEQNWFFDKDKKPLFPINVHNMTSNELCIYALANAFEIFPVDRFMEQGIFYTFDDPTDPHLFQIPKNEALDINTEEEFVIAQDLWRYNNGKRL